MSLRIGIDTGGTFTDLIGIDSERGEAWFAKRPSTPAAPSDAVFDALRASGAPVQGAEAIVLGTTIATNALLERRGARVIYLTTKGFEDIPYIQRVDKKSPYDLQWQKPEPFVRHRDCLGVAERVSWKGDVLTELRPVIIDEVLDALASRLAEDGTERNAVAINLLFSFANPAHEAALQSAIAERFPGLPVSVSSEIAPIWREYERASTTIIDAYLKPLAVDFVAGVVDGLRQRDWHAPFFLMKSNGGQMLASAAAKRPAELMLSGVAGGLIAGRHFGLKAGYRNLITFDMGGTSTDVGVVIEGQLNQTTSYELDFGIPVTVPSVDVTTIGAGGGSIAWKDQGGLLRVGPQSAGARPGPACYGRGGSQPTVTDANLVLGRLDAEWFLGGDMSLDVAAAREVVGRLADELGLTLEAAAESVIEFANENMANAIRLMTIERGLDPREFALVAFGGAGPLHAAAVASAVGIERIVIPPHPGLTSALGALLADVRVDKQWTQFWRSTEIDLKAMNGALRHLESAALEELRAGGYAGEPLLMRAVGMRYSGQNYEQEVALPDASVTEASAGQLFERFHLAHEHAYGYRHQESVIEITHLNVTAIGASSEVRLQETSRGEAVAPVRSRQTFFKGHGFVSCPVHRRGDFSAGFSLEGPALVDSEDSTILVYPDQELKVQENGALLITWRQAKAGPDRAASVDINSVTLSIIHHHLVNICTEMGTALMRTAYSPIFSEARDFSCVIFDAGGKLIAQGEYNPAQIGAATFIVKWTIEELGIEAFKPGDVVIHNDPYRGGCHMPEHTVIQPVYHDGKLRAFVACIGHLAEIGGMAPGGFASNATEVFQEGLRLPPVKLMDRGEYVKDVWRIILSNHRTPRNTWGDFHAMLGALKVAERRLEHLYDKYGADFIGRACDALMDYAERWMTAELRRIPDGVYRFEDFMEDDGVADTPVHLRVRLTVRDGTFVADFSESDHQALGPVNATYGVTASATYNAVLQITNPHIPRNAGCYRPITVISRPGTVTNVQLPGSSVGGNTETQPKLVLMILGALSAVIPDRVSACEGLTSCNFLFGGIHPDTSEYYVNYHFEASGWGGRVASDGNSAQNHIHGNCRNTPVEIFEARYPWLTSSYALVPDSAGAGRQRGGLSTRRELTVLAPEIHLSVFMDHVKVGAWGLFGGLPGRTANVLVKRVGDNAFRPFTEAFGTISPSKFANIRLKAGDQVLLESAGGGGYGDPTSRPRTLVECDVAEGFVSADAAKELYSLPQGASVGASSESG